MNQRLRRVLLGNCLLHEPARGDEADEHQTIAS
jgi:hypothetical protein